MQDAAGQPCPPGITGEIKVWRRDAWIPTKDLGRIDEDGYFYPRRPRRRRHHLRRLDDERHRDRGRDPQASAGAGSRGDRRARALRGQVVKAFVVTAPGRRQFVEGDPGPRARASRQHEYPRQVAFVAELPKTPAGKVHRKVLRERERPSRLRRRHRLSTRRRTLLRNRRTSSGFPKITEEGLDDLRKRIGVKIGVTAEPWCYEATRDNIRHYAHGIGDDNPLWCDPDYAAKTSYGDIVALPSFLFATSRIVSGYVGGLPGVHAMWSGADWTWHKPVLRNDTISHRGDAEGPGRARDALRRPRGAADLPRRFLQPARRQSRRRRQLVLPHRARSRAREGHQVQGGQRPCATPLHRAGARRGLRPLRRGRMRGARTRYWEDVKEGEALPTMVKGPMTVTGFIAYAQGWGGLYIRANKLAWRLIDAHPGLGIKNRFGIPDVPSACTGKKSSRSRSARPALTITAPSAARG